jgi:hypothetical protein
LAFLHRNKKMNSVYHWETILTLFRTIAAASMAAALFAVPASADNVLSGAEAQQKLAGQTFDFSCVDGTRGHATYGKSGVATASYRLPSTSDDAALQKDQGRVRADGGNVCIRWGTLNGGEEACFRMTERKPGVYRIADGAVRWCDLSTRGPGARAERN